jgi:hypothetical protein
MSYCEKYTNEQRWEIRSIYQTNRLYKRENVVQFIRGTKLNKFGERGRQTDKP